MKRLQDIARHLLPIGLLAGLLSTAAQAAIDPQLRIVSALRAARSAVRHSGEKALGMQNVQLALKDGTTTKKKQLLKRKMSNKITMSTK